MLPTGMRHRVRSGMVPLLPGNERGDLHEGFIRVPLRLVKADVHSNERHEFDRLVAQSIATWADWKQKQGWFIQGTPRVRGPFDPPSASPTEIAADIRKYGPHKRYTVHARFTREYPKWIPRDADTWFQEQAMTFDVDLRNQSPESPDEHVETAPHNPMEYAEARRQSLGLKRSDFLIGDLSEPLGNEVI